MCIRDRDVFCDHAGFSTYETMYRAKHVFGAERIIIATQTYHLYRAIYDANGLGMEAVGVASDSRSYSGQTWYDLREIPARTKDFFYAVSYTHLDVYKRQFGVLYALPGWNDLQG